MIVVDANVVIAWLVEQEATQFARKAHRKDKNWILPHLWRAEFASALSGMVRDPMPGGPHLAWAQTQQVWKNALQLLPEKKTDFSVDQHQVAFFALSARF